MSLSTGIKGLLYLFLTHLCFLKGEISQTTGSPQMYQAAEDDLELLMFLSQVLALQACAIMPDLKGFLFGWFG